jgi:hypothetical protein
VTVEVGVEVTEEEAAVVAPRACRRHPPVDAERCGWRDEGNRAGGQRHWIEEPALPSPPPSPSPPSTPEPEPVDGFEFGVTLNYGGDPDKFGNVVDVRTNQVVLTSGRTRSC